MSDLSRREFLGQAAGTVAAAAVTSGIASAASGGDKLTVALIGCGGMGGNHLKLLAERKDAHLAYLCDADADRLAAAVKTVEAAGKPAPKPVKDMRTIFDDKSVDAVWLPMPDHWHAPATILACAAGKHVYVEKPCSHNLREGRLMLEAARKHNRVVQVGTQSRSTPHVQRAMQLLREGAIGDVLVAKAWNSQLVIAARSRRDAACHRCGCHRAGRLTQKLTPRKIGHRTGSCGGDEGPDADHSPSRLSALV